MLARVLGRLPPLRLAAIGLVLLAAVGVALWLTPSGDYLFLPVEARPVDPLITVASERERPPRRRDEGGIYYVSVLVRRASLLERLFPAIYDGSTLVDGEAFKPPGISDDALHEANLREMSRSQKIAAAVALRALGYRVPARPDGVVIAAVGDDAPAAEKVRPGDVVLAVDGERVLTPLALRRALAAGGAGKPVTLRLRSARRVRNVTVTTIADPAQGGRPIIGVIPEQALDIELPVKIRIDAGDVGGPSAGLPFALDVMEELGRDVDRGYRVAATGEIELDGTVVEIGGIKQKTIGARRAAIDVFLVPAGDNARDARRHADGMRIVAVKSFRQALRALATLPPAA